jgi:hypothetical protein
VPTSCSRLEPIIIDETLEIGSNIYIFGEEPISSLSDINLMIWNSKVNNKIGLWGLPFS